MAKGKYTHRRGHAGRYSQRRQRPITSWILPAVSIAFAVMGMIVLIATLQAPSAEASAQVHTPQSSSIEGSQGGPAIRLMKKDGGAITQDDVVAYVQKVGMPQTVGASSPITAIEAELLTSSEISKRLQGESTGFADNELLWFVEVHGTFVFHAPGGKTITSDQGYQVFDPTTGNIVMFGSFA